MRACDKANAYCALLVTFGMRRSSKSYEPSFFRSAQTKVGSAKACDDNHYNRMFFNPA